MQTLFLGISVEIYKLFEYSNYEIEFNDGQTS